MRFLGHAIVSVSVKNLALRCTRVAVIACVAVASGANGQPHAPPKERFPAELDQYIQRVLVDGQIPGIAIGIVRNDSVLVAKGYGVRELGKPDRVDENTVFDIASLSKS